VKVFKENSENAQTVLISLKAVVVKYADLAIGVTIYNGNSEVFEEGFDDRGDPSES